ncbi:Pleiotropic drug resistance protein 1 [Paenibacillus sp. FSL R7-269]|uniref:ABC transporter permease n=1 Tax=Paenibacillus sp. FSL R7-269 TaxID=1226755 RepID=UPI0003E20C39|nr:ABC transporter permease [Paenibacillus sp. FSL R7-269]ETT36330.1 Pleiotropic drug resistance protein 1 [Paenibacillus sp. FSL R7-269]
MQFIVMVKNQLKLMLRNRIAIFATIAVPLILTFLFSFSQGSGQVSLYVADADQSLYSNQLMDMIQQHQVKIVHSDETTIKKKVDDQDIPFGLVIHQGFDTRLSSGKELPMYFVQNYENGDGMILEEIITGEVSTLQKVIHDTQMVSKELNIEDSGMNTSIFAELHKASNLTVDDQTISSGEKTHDKATARLIGFLVMFIWFVVVQGLRTLIDEKENNTLSRLLSTPVNYKKYLLAKMMSTYLFGAVHIFVILAAGKYLLKIRIADHALAVGVLFAAYLFALTSVTMIVIPFMKNQKQFTSSASILIAVTGMLGGSFFSMEMAPQFMRTLSKLTPESWAIESLSDVIFGHQTVTSEWVPLVVFAVIGAVGLAAGFLLTGRELKAMRS